MLESALIGAGQILEAGPQVMAELTEEALGSPWDEPSNNHGISLRLCTSDI